MKLLTCLVTILKIIHINYDFLFISSIENFIPKNTYNLKSKWKVLKMEDIYMHKTSHNFRLKHEQKQG